MRAFAADLRRRARELGDQADRVAARPRAMHFRGPAAERFRAFVANEQGAIQAICGDLEAQAVALEAEARETEQAQETWRRRISWAQNEVHRLEAAGKSAWDHVDSLRRAIF